MTTPLHQRLRKFGTITKKPRDIPDAVFAPPSTIHWMHALSILVKSNGTDFQSARNFYGTTQKCQMSKHELNTVSEQLLFAFHQIVSLRALGVVPNKADVGRMAIVSWYYGIYGAASAMIAAADRFFQENHTATARHWDAHFPSRGLVMAPFADRLTSILKSDVKAGLESVRSRGKHSLTIYPGTVEQGWGCLAKYLSGTARWEQWNCEEQLKSTPEFKKLNVNDFRTKAARSLRDSAYRRRSAAFLQQASRYRGKANYRDAIYLAYGRTVADRIEVLVSDLSTLLEGFAAMAAGYCSHRMGKDNWRTFIENIDAN